MNPKEYVIEPVAPLEMTVYPDGKTDFPTKKAMFEQQQALADWTREASEILSDLSGALKDFLQGDAKPGQEEKKAAVEPEEDGMEDAVTPKPTYRPIGDGSKVWTRNGNTIPRTDVPAEVLESHSQPHQIEI